MMIVAGHEDSNVANKLRHDSSFRLGFGAGSRDRSCAVLLTHNLTHGKHGRYAQSYQDGARGGRVYRDSFKRPPRQVVPYINDTFDAVRGEQQLRLFSTYYDEFGFQPILVFDERGVWWLQCCVRRVARAEKSLLLTSDA